jgi:hypothetical protein
MDANQPQPLYEEVLHDKMEGVGDQYDPRFTAYVEVLRQPS